MAFRDDEDPPLGMYDYAAPDHPIQCGYDVEDALFELRQLAQREGQLRTRIVELTRDIRPAMQATSGSVTCLSAYRAARRRTGWKA